MGAQRLQRVFIRAEMDGTESEDLSVKAVSHFPGPVEIISDRVADFSSGDPWHLSKELHGGVCVQSTTFVGPRAQVVKCWPNAARIIPAEQREVMVTLEERLEPEVTDWIH